MWEGAGVHGSHEAFLLQTAGGVTYHGGDHAHASGIPPWLGPPGSASPYMTSDVLPASFGADIPEASGPFGVDGYSEGGGLGQQYGRFGLEPTPQQHTIGGGDGAPSLQMGPHGSRMVSGLLGSLHAELGRLSAKDIMDAKALAASRSHSEAERRRRQRINSHLSRLRSLLPNTTKTDKASLLAEVIEHVKELKRQTSEVPAQRLQLLPTEADELAVDAAANDEEGNLVARASLCCEDRQDLVTDIGRALATLRLRARRAEIATLGGRVRSVLLITEVGEEDVGGEEECRHYDDECAASSHRTRELIASIQEALRGVMDHKAASSDTSSGGGNIKRQRVTGEQEQGSF